MLFFVKFIYSEKATQFCKIFTLLLSYVVPVKSKVKISQNFVAFSEYMNSMLINPLKSRILLSKIFFAALTAQMPQKCKFVLRIWQ